MIKNINMVMRSTIGVISTGCKSDYIKMDRNMKVIGDMKENFKMDCLMEMEHLLGKIEARIICYVKYCRYVG